MEIIPFICGPLATNCFLLLDQQTGKGVVIDAPPHSAHELVSQAERRKATIEAIILTHSHWDHCNDAALLKKMTNAKVLIHSADEYRIIEPHKHALYALDIEMSPLKADAYLNDNDILSFGTTKLKVLHTPGHTEGSVCLVCYDMKKVFCGDTVFMQSVGRTDLPGGNGEALMNSIREKIMTLPDNFELLCGHGDFTTIGDERKMNPFIDGFYV